MNYNENEILEIVRNLLGDEATGVYINDLIVGRDLLVGDMPLYSCVGETSFSIESTVDFTVTYGLTRLCIIPRKKTDWVIKIPITHIYSDNWEEGETTYDDYDSENYLGTKCVGEASYDLCDEERVIYQNLDPMTQEVLANIEYVGDFNGIPIYVQERVKVSESAADCNDVKYGYNPSYILQNEVDQINKIYGYTEYSDAFINNIILTYGFLKAISIFDEITNFIDDVHDENYGYDFFGNSKIFDYAGYQRSYYTYYSKEAA